MKRLSTGSMLALAVATSASGQQRNPAGQPGARPSPVTIQVVSNDLAPQNPCRAAIAHAFSFAGLDNGQETEFKMGSGTGYSAAAICTPGPNLNHEVVATASTDPSTALSALTSVTLLTFSSVSPKPGVFPGRAVPLELGTFTMDGSLSQVAGSAKQALQTTGLALQFPHVVDPQHEVQIIGQGEAGTVLVAIHYSHSGTGLLSLTQTQYVVVLAAADETGRAAALRNQVRSLMTAPGPAPRVR